MLTSWSLGFVVSPSSLHRFPGPRILTGVPTVRLFMLALLRSTGLPLPIHFFPWWLCWDVSQCVMLGYVLLTSTLSWPNCSALKGAGCFRGGLWWFHFFHMWLFECFCIRAYGSVSVCSCGWILSAVFLRWLSLGARLVDWGDRRWRQSSTLVRSVVFTL